MNHVFKTMLRPGLQPGSLQGSLMLQTHAHHIVYAGQGREWDKWTEKGPDTQASLGSSYTDGEYIKWKNLVGWQLGHVCVKQKQYSIHQTLFSSWTQRKTVCPSLLCSWVVMWLGSWKVGRGSSSLALKLPVQFSILCLLSVLPLSPFASQLKAEGTVQNSKALTNGEPSYEQLLVPDDLHWV